MFPLGESAVNWHDVLEVLWVSAATGIGVTAAFAVALFGATRSVDLQRDGRGAEATPFAVLGLVAGAVVVAAVVLGIVVMAHKT